jgi:hypothetical protein
MQRYKEKPIAKEKRWLPRGWAEGRWKKFFSPIQLFCVILRFETNNLTRYGTTIPQGKNHHNPVVINCDCTYPVYLFSLLLCV